MIAILSGGYGPGGVQSIQLVIFKELIARGEEVILFDFDDGWVYQAFKRTGCEFQFVKIHSGDKLDYSDRLSKKDLLIVFNGNVFENILLFGNSECKVLFWEVYYPWVSRFIYTRWFPFKWLANSQELKFLSLILQNNAFYFIDTMGKGAVEARLKTVVDDSYYLPIPVDDFIENNQTRDIQEKIVISYVGRSVAWKINPAIKILQDVKASVYREIIVVNIFCDNKANFRSYVERYIDCSSIEINYFEGFDQDELKNKLILSDLHFAMGTSALDGAKLGLPTVVIDASYNIFPESYKYRWIYEADEYGLGKMIELEQGYEGGIHSMDMLLNSISLAWAEVSKKSQSYVKNNYNVCNVVDMLIKAKDTSNLRINYFRDLLYIRYLRILRNLGIR